MSQATEQINLMSVHNAETVLSQAHLNIRAVTLQVVRFTQVRSLVRTVE